MKFRFISFVLFCFLAANALSQGSDFSASHSTAFFTFDPCPAEQLTGTSSDDDAVQFLVDDDKDENESSPGRKREAPTASGLSANATFTSRFYPSKYFFTPATLPVYLSILENRYLLNRVLRI